MDATATPEADATLAELAALGLRAARVVTGLMEIEQATAEVAAAWLSKPGTTPASLGEAAAAGQAIDAVAALMAQAVPRTEILARALDRLSRAVRRCIALRQRLQSGWPRTAADDRPAMLRRQVARSVTRVIRDTTDGEPAERLFDDLTERLNDPNLAEELLSLPVEEVVRRICRDLGLAATALPKLTPHPSPPCPPRRAGSE